MRLDILKFYLYYGLFISFDYSVQANVNNQKCASNEECDGTKSLTCKEGVCACKEDNLYWNTKAANCGRLHIHLLELVSISQNISLIELSYQTWNERKVFSH
jgi:hypothetical protein